MEAGESVDFVQWARIFFGGHDLRRSGHGWEHIELVKKKRGILDGVHWKKIA